MPIISHFFAVCKNFLLICVNISAICKSTHFQTQGGEMPLIETHESKKRHCKVNMKKLGPEISQYRYATSRNSRLRFLDSLSPAHCAGVRLFKAE